MSALLYDLGMLVAAGAAGVGGVLFGERVGEAYRRWRGR